MFADKEMRYDATRKKVRMKMKRDSTGERSYAQLPQLRPSGRSKRNRRFLVDHWCESQGAWIRWYNAGKVV